MHLQSRDPAGVGGRAGPGRIQLQRAVQAALNAAANCSQAVEEDLFYLHLLFSKAFFMPVGAA